MSAEEASQLDRSKPLANHLARLAFEKSTGILVTAGDETKRELLFVNGEIRAARSSLEDEKLGMWLVHRERISEDDRALTLLAQGGSDAPPLGHLLVTRGCISHDSLETELQELTLAIIRRASAESGGEIEFLDGKAHEQPDTLPDLFTSQIILIAARACEDDAAMRAAVGSPDRLVWPSSDLEHLLEDYNLTPTEGFVLSRLDGAQTIANLIQLSALTEEQAISTLYPLIVAGVIEVGDPATQPAAAATVGREAVAVADRVDEQALSEMNRQDRSNILRIAEEVTRVDHYRALGLRPGVPAEDIAKAWKRAQEKYSNERTVEHHLRDLGPQLEAILERAREAHEVLSKARDRRRYDRILQEVERDRQSLSGTGVRGETDAKVRNAIVEANVKRADELIHDGELYLAIQLLEQACALDPRPGELIKLARLLLRNPLWTNRALSCMRRAIQVDPNFVEAWLELAMFWRRRRNQERERKALEKALAAAPENPRAKQLYRELAGQKDLDRLLRRAEQSRR